MNPLSSMFRRNPNMQQNQMPNNPMDPKQMVMNLLSSGRMSQQQFEQFSQMAEMFQKQNQMPNNPMNVMQQMAKMFQNRR